MLKILTLENNPIPSKCYIVYDDEISRECLIIDPGSEDSLELFSTIESLNLEPRYSILTHEHFDHCWGVNQLRSRYPSLQLLCSKEVSKCIGNEKLNCSKFYENNKGFEILPADICVEKAIYWNNFQIEFIHTPGHTNGSITVLIQNHLFTGDAYIPGTKTVTKLPGGNKELAEKSILKINEILKQGNISIHPGH